MAAEVQTIGAMIIPAAGFGTRMQGITGGGCKELLEIGGKPAIRYALEEAAAGGVSRVGIVIRKGKEAIRDFVQHSAGMAALRERLRIEFFFQTEMNGECGAIVAAAELAADRPFLVHYPDNVICGTPGLVTGMLREKYAALAGDVVALTRVTDAGACQSACPVGLAPVADDLYRLYPAESPGALPHDLRTTGVYIASPGFLVACRELLPGRTGGEIKDRDARCLLARRGGVVHGLDARTPILDVGNPAGYTLACRMQEGN